MSTARSYNQQMIHYLRKSIDYSMDGLTYVKVGTLPAGALILKPLSGVSVNVPFDAAGSNTLNIGTPGNVDLYMTLGALGSIAFVPLDEAVSMLIGAADMDIVAEVVLTGTAAAAGTAEVVIAYIPDNDG